ncbi:MAG TPA: NFACT family protein [Pyrinomonadaceae bacterium]|nr:NFACT family protein [Pyrinomonadaceae bacterium]
MNNSTLEKICSELDDTLIGQRFGKIFTLSRFETAIDFRVPDSRFLFISIEASRPRIYLVKRRLKDLEKQSLNPSPFLLYVRKRLSGGVVRGVSKVPDERVLRMSLSAETETGEINDFALIVQLTGRSSNIFLADANDFILESMRPNTGPGQLSGERYMPPPRPARTYEDHANDDLLAAPENGPLSEGLDNYYLEQESERKFRSRVATARAKLNAEITKRKTLLRKLNQDLEHHGDAEKWKRTGDLLLANTATARRDGDKIFVTDFFDEQQPEIAVEADENLSVTEAAEKYFKRYTKARNAAGEIARRQEAVQKELERLGKEQTRLEQAADEHDEKFFAEPEGKQKPAIRAKKTAAFNGARSFTSSDGFEILVGKRAKDNDYLTFRVAGSLDMWLHAADYPGSHVVVRTPSRKEIPQRTLLEAAQLAAFYSDAGQQPKAAVHYTQKKFVNKPRGAAPGLVSLASFKTILVEPKIPV